MVVADRKRPRHARNWTSRWKGSHSLHEWSSSGACAAQWTTVASCTYTTAIFAEEARPRAECAVRNFAREARDMDCSTVTNERLWSSSCFIQRKPSCRVRTVGMSILTLKHETNSDNIQPDKSDLCSTSRVMCMISCNGHDGLLGAVGLQAPQ